jgi:hypothetical protein
MVCLLVDLKVWPKFWSTFQTEDVLSTKTGFAVHIYRDFPVKRMGNLLKNLGFCQKSGICG